jgi:TRAP-type C4-dicarboxylate transport system substrate-binding protein
MRSMYNVRRPIHEPADMRGLKVRVPRSDVLIEALAAMDANPTPIPLGDVFTGLQTHLLDGAENNWATYQSAHHYEMARYWSETRHGCSPEALLLSRATFDALSAPDKELLLATAQGSVPVMRGLWETKQATARQTALNGGAIANDVDRAAFEAHVAPMRRRYEQDAQIGGLIRRIQAQA